MNYCGYNAHRDALLYLASLYDGMEREREGQLDGDYTIRNDARGVQEGRRMVLDGTEEV